MSILYRNIAKWKVARCGKLVEKAQLNPVRSQNYALGEIRKVMRGTQIYQDMEICGIKTYEDWLRYVEPKEWNFYEPYINKIVEGEKKVLFNDSLRFVAMTSGTTSQVGYMGKKIPYNDKMFSTYRNCILGALSFIRKDVPTFDVIDSPTLSYGSYSNMTVSDKGIEFGYISGLLNKKLKKIKYLSDETLCIEDWDAKVEKIIDEVKSVDIFALNAVPVYMIKVLERMKEKLGVRNLSDVWPNLEVFFYTGTSIGRYRNYIDEIVGRKLKYFGSYFSTEGAFGFCPKKNDKSLAFNTNSFLYSFNPIRGDKKKILGVHELSCGEMYSVNIGSPNGLIHLKMGDVIKVNNSDPLLYEIIGREGTAINMATENLDENLTNEAITNLQNKLGIYIIHYFLYPSVTQHQEQCYEWALLLRNGSESVSHKIIASKIDQILMELSLDYSECRKTNKVIAAPNVRIVSQDIERDYFKKYNSNGQLKMKQFFGDADEFEDFVISIQSST